MLDRFVLSEFGGLHSTTLRDLFKGYVADRDGKLTFARAYHNYLPHYQELEMASQPLELQ